MEVNLGSDFEQQIFELIIFFLGFENIFLIIYLHKLKEILKKIAKFYLKLYNIAYIPGLLDIYRHFLFFLFISYSIAMVCLNFQLTLICQD